MTTTYPILILAAAIILCVYWLATDDSFPSHFGEND